MIRVHTPSGELPVRFYTFSDNQRHVELQSADDGGFRQATIEVSIDEMGTLFEVLLLKDVLDHNGYVTSLDIRYLLGARMDRRINNRQPATLSVIARLILGAGFRRIRVLDPHSEVSLHELGAIAVYPSAIANQVLSNYDPSQTCIVIPDQGAVRRCEALLRPVAQASLFPWVYCTKHRDMDTGKLSGFQVANPELVRGKDAVIFDDICDGGGTFSGNAAALKEAGAKQVDMFVTHGLFSKGLPIPEITFIYTTDSHPRAQAAVLAEHGQRSATVFPVEMPK